MKRKRIVSLLLALVLAAALLPTTALAVTTVNTIKITMSTPTVGKALPTDAEATTASSYVTSVEWLGETDNGLMRANTAYSATIMVEIKPDKDAKYTTGTINATVNGGSTGVVVSRISDTKVRIRYNLSAAGTPVKALTSFTIHTPAPRVGFPLYKTATTYGSSDVEVTSVEWTGELDSNRRVKTDAAYTLTMNVKIKDGKNAMFSLRGTTAYINDNDTKGTFTRLSDTTGIVSYTFPIITSDEKAAEEKAKEEAQKAKEHAEELARRWSLAEADARAPLNDPITIVVNKDTIPSSSYDPDAHVWSGGQLTTLDGEVIPADKSKYSVLRVTGVVYDMYVSEPGRNAAEPAFTELPNVKAIWLSPNCDIQGFLDALPRYRRTIYDNERNMFATYDRIVLIPASLYPNGPTYTIFGAPFCRVMLYDGDVYEAAKKGISAARDWCTNLVYTAALSSYDRRFAGVTCTELSKAYYSCARCGKIEYNPNHYFDANNGSINAGKTTAHSYIDRILTDEHFVGINADGDRVYLYACEYCGRDPRYHDLNMTIEELIKNTGPTTQETYELVMSRNRAKWAEGGNTYNQVLQATVDKDYVGTSFAVATDTYVTAATSGWAREDVNYASQEGLIDKSLLGTDYTTAINRLQFVSVAVKMAEKMTGKTITPAPSGTFLDTDSEYARKAYAAGITTGVGNDYFDPNGTLTRQQMATFLYRALQYVKDNSDTEYSIYDSQLGNYSDAGQVAGWAADAMAFMNAFGLIKGISSTVLGPESPCTIEQAVVVALRSLDAGLLGWYQYNGDPFSVANVGYKTHYTRYTATGYVNWASGVKMCTGERVFVTAIVRNPSKGGYATAYYGEFYLDRYGRSAYINLEDFRAIKDR